MTDIVPETSLAAPAPASPETDVQGPDFAAMLAARLCHDFISPASAIVGRISFIVAHTGQNNTKEIAGRIAEPTRLRNRTQERDHFNKQRPAARRDAMA